MKKKRYARRLLEELKQVPNISVACERVGLSRNTVYRWCREDPEFKRELEMSIDLGVQAVSDLAESKLMARINRDDWPAIRYWLDNRKLQYIKPRPPDAHRKPEARTLAELLMPLSKRSDSET